MEKDCCFTQEKDWFRYRAAAIIIEDGCVLLVGNEKEDYLYSVGGGVHMGETAEQAVAREVYEETGLAVIDYAYRGIVTFVSNQYGTEHMHLFTIGSYAGKPKECEEGELRWIKKEELLRLPMWEGDRIFLELLDKKIPFFSLKLVYSGETLIQAVLNGKTIR